MRRYVYLLLIAAAASGMWYWTRPTPEQVIEQRLRELAKAVTPQGTEGNIAKIAASQRIAGYFTGDASINLDGVPGVNSAIQGRTEISQAIMATRNWTGGSPVLLENIRVIIGPSDTNATAIFGASVRRTSGENNFGQTLKTLWQYTEGKWLIHSLEPASLVPVQQ